VNSDPKIVNPRQRGNLCLQIGVFRIRGAGYVWPVIFRKLRLWIDAVPRSGPEAMAVDEWLLEMAETPVLRVYGWLGDWGSVGYFGEIAAARRSFPGLRWVRRWTGGGTVDHRADWTYTVTAPSGERLVEARGAESYRLLHSRLQSVLGAEEIDARLSTGAGETGDALCFENPVSHDIVGLDGKKLAGAGQRRTRRGLLHQGSVAGPCEVERSQIRATRLAACLAEEWEVYEYDPPAAAIAERVNCRYGMERWTERR
jgi:lipoyl(octanoyl) transferase